MKRVLLFTEYHILTSVLFIALELPTVGISSPNEDVVVKYEADSLKLVCDGSALPPPTTKLQSNPGND